jgi:hypothetical protein
LAYLHPNLDRIVQKTKAINFLKTALAMVGEELIKWSWLLSNTQNGYQEKKIQ